VQHIDALALGAHVQRAGYVAGLGGSWSVGATALRSVHDAIELALSVEYQRADFSDGTRWIVFGVGLGATYSF
jgi:hypothetical protein